MLKFRDCKEFSNFRVLTSIYSNRLVIFAPSRLSLGKNRDLRLSGDDFSTVLDKRLTFWSNSSNLWVQFWESDLFSLEMRWFSNWFLKLLATSSNFKTFSSISASPEDSLSFWRAAISANLKAFYFSNSDLSTKSCFSSLEIKNFEDSAGRVVTIKESVSVVKKGASSGSLEGSFSLPRFWLVLSKKRRIIKTKKIKQHTISNWLK